MIVAIFAATSTEVHLNILNDDKGWFPSWLITTIDVIATYKVELFLKIPVPYDRYNIRETLKSLHLHIYFIFCL